MRLSALLASLSPAPAGSRGGDDPIVRGLSYDSRAVAPGDLFVALRGSAVDGHAYLGQALGLGAVAVVVEEVPSGVDLRGRPAIVVADTRRALAALATRFYGEPSAELSLVGVTGTNGKTSTTYLVESILARAGRSVGLIGTVESRFGGQRRRSINTTPESLDLQTSLRDMLSRGADAVVMEVSSHGLVLGRVDGCRFRVGAFTNLTQDHLDFHGTMSAYRDAKALLFTRYLAKDGIAVVNVDDPSGAELARAARDAGATVIRVSRGAEAEVRLETADVSMGGTRARVAIPGARLALSVPLLGDFNLENVLVACGVALALGIAPEQIEAGVAACPQVPGRVERVAAGEGAQPTVLVDYAHTPDAVDKLLRTLRPLTSWPPGHGVRLRRRPRPRQAPADGRGGRALERPRDRDQRQSAHRGPARDPGRRGARPRKARTRRARSAGRGGPRLFGDDRPPLGDRARDRPRPSGRHRRAGRQGP